MKRQRKHWCLALLLAFALRALVPAGLMLQLPAAFGGEVGGLGYVICPVQNPGLDLEQLRDPASGTRHAHHHEPAAGEADARFGIANDNSLCPLLASSTESSIESAPARFPQFGLHAVLIAASNNDTPNTATYTTRQTRAPPAVRG